MDNITILVLILEFVVVGIIVVFQAIQALKTRKKINNLRSIIPKIDFFEIKKYNIPVEYLQVYPPKEILDNLSIYGTQINNDNTTSNQINETDNGEEEFTNEISLLT